MKQCLGKDGRPLQFGAAKAVTCWDWEERFSTYSMMDIVAFKGLGLGGIWNSISSNVSSITSSSNVSACFVSSSCFTKRAANDYLSLANFIPLFMHLIVAWPAPAIDTAWSSALHLRTSSSQHLRMSCVPCCCVSSCYIGALKLVIKLFVCNSLMLLSPTSVYAMQAQKIKAKPNFVI